jgi:hypothetical protein
MDKEVKRENIHKRNTGKQGMRVLIWNILKRVVRRRIVKKVEKEQKNNGDDFHSRSVTYVMMLFLT